MLPYELADLIRADQLERAAFERWLRRLGLLWRAHDRPVQRLVPRIRVWLKRDAHPVRCELAQPACGLSLTA